MSNDARELIAKEIGFAGRDRHDTCQNADEFWQHSGDEWREGFLKQADAILSALPAIIAGMVKPLVWEGETSKASTGEYNVIKTMNKRNDKYMVNHIDAFRRSIMIGYVEGINAAKETANAHHLATILAALGVKQ